MNKPPQAIVGVLFCALQAARAFASPLLIQAPVGQCTRNGASLRPQVTVHNASNSNRKSGWSGAACRRGHSVRVRTNRPTELRSCGGPEMGRRERAVLGYLPRPSEVNLVPTRSKAKRIPHRDAINQLLIITNNPNAGHFSEPPSCRVENDPVPALSLGPVQRHISALDQGLRRICLALLERHTGRNRHR